MFVHGSYRSSSEIPACASLGKWLLLICIKPMSYVPVRARCARFTALGAPFEERGLRMSEQIPLLRRLLTEPAVTHVGEFDRITGAGKVEIRPTGYVDISAGYQGQNIKNPTLPERSRKTGGFDFNENAQLQVDANIGDKIHLPINYNTLANFDYENQLKFDYQGKEDEKILAVGTNNPIFTSIEDYEQLYPHLHLEIEHFFTVYKELEAKSTKIVGWQDAGKARDVVVESRDRFSTTAKS